MSEINFNQYKEGVASLPEFDALVAGRPGSNREISEIVFKLLQGQDLTPSESTKLKSAFEGDVDIEKLTKFLKLQGNAEGLADTGMSENPFADVDPTKLGDKRKNFLAELKSFQERAKQVFGEFIYGKLQVSRDIQTLISQLEGDSSALQVDTFGQLLAEQGDRRTGSSSNDHTGVFDLGDPSAPKFSTAALNLAIDGLSEDPDSVIDIEDTSVAGLVDDPGEELKTKAADFKSLSFEGFGRQFELYREKIDASEHIHVRFLERKMQGLEKLDKDSVEDREAVKQFLTLNGADPSSAEIEEFIGSFNDAANSPPAELAHIALAKRAAAVEARKPKGEQAQTETLVELSQLMDNDRGLQRTHPLIRGLMDKTDALTRGLDPEQKKEFLQTYVNDLLAQQQAEANEANPVHHSKVDQDELYRDFQRHIGYLKAYVNSFRGNQKEEIKHDLRRMIRGGEASPDLIAAFGGGEDAKALQGLDFLTRGTGNPKFAEGLLDLMFTEPRRGQAAIDFHGLVQEAQSFEELANNLAGKIAASQAGKVKMAVPDELLASGDTTKTFVGDPSVTYFEERIQRDAEGKPVGESQGFEIFDLLRVNPEDITFDLTEGKDNLAEELSEKAPDLYKMLVHLHGEKLEKDGDGKFKYDDISSETKTKINEDIFALIKASDKEEGTDGELSNEEASLQEPKVIAKYLERMVEKFENNYLDFKFAESDESLAERTEARSNLIEFLKDNRINIYREVEVADIYHPNEYAQMLKDFAMATPHVHNLIMSNKGIYQLPRGLKLDTGRDHQLTPGQLGRQYQSSAMPSYGTRGSDGDVWLGKALAWLMGDDPMSDPLSPYGSGESQVASVWDNDGTQEAAEALRQRSLYHNPYADTDHIDPFNSFGLRRYS